MEQEVQEHEKKKKAAAQTTTADGREIALVVHRVVYPGVSIIFGDRVTQIAKERRGPFRIVRRVHNRVEEILLIDRISGSITTLGARVFEPKPGDFNPAAWAPPTGQPAA
jgi:hypothetical protein